MVLSFLLNEMGSPIAILMISVCDGPPLMANVANAQQANVNHIAAIFNALKWHIACN